MTTKVIKNSLPELNGREVEVYEYDRITQTYCCVFLNDRTREEWWFSKDQLEARKAPRRPRARKAASNPRVLRQRGK